MTAKNKATTLEKIQSMQPRHNTNLWHGIREGLKMFRGFRSSQTGRVPALFVLTDGLPNHMCPQYGYVPMLRAMGPLPATIHTFGFGYRLRSGLLKSIAELGGGNYSFIPDPGMMVRLFQSLGFDFLARVEADQPGHCVYSRHRKPPVDLCQ